MRIEWKTERPIPVSHVLMVDVSDETNPEGDYQDATPDDLRAACAAVGLVVDQGEDQRLAAHNALDRAERAEQQLGFVNENVVRLSAARDTEKARAEKAASRIREAETETHVELGTLVSAYADACRNLGVEVGQLYHGVFKSNAERDDLRTKLAAAEARSEKYCLDLGTMQTQRDDARALAKENVRQVQEARRDYHAAMDRAQAAESRLSALTAPVEGEPTAVEMKDEWFRRDDLTGPEGVGQFALDQWRAGYAAIARSVPPGDGEPTDDDLINWEGGLWGRADGRRRLFRYGVSWAAARHQPTEPRATEEELWKLYDNTYDRVFRESDGKPDVFPGAIAGKAAREALTARVRAERLAGLVERAVKANVDIEVSEASLAYPGHRHIRIATPNNHDMPGRKVPDAEAAATLDAMLTEVGA